MKQTIKAKGPITKPLLEGLTIEQPNLPVTQNAPVEKPSVSKTNEKQADLVHDSGNGYNTDLSFIQD